MKLLLTLVGLWITIPALLILNEIAIKLVGFIAKNKAEKNPTCICGQPTQNFPCPECGYYGE